MGTRIAEGNGVWPERSSNNDDDRARTLRAAMMREQLRARGISDRRVLAAMAEAPRHLFTGGWSPEIAYGDGPLPIGYGQTISQPLIVAMMLEALELRGEERVLDIGTGSGYQAALLGRLAREVYSVEIVPELARSARALLDRLGASNVHVIEGDGSLGWAAAAPYQAIVVAAAAPEVPRPLVEQLDDGGRLVVPVGDDAGQSLIRVRRLGRQTHTEFLTWCAFVPLVGEHGRQ